MFIIVAIYLKIDEMISSVNDFGYGIVGYV